MCPKSPPPPLLLSRSRKPQEPGGDIPLEKLPPLYGGRRAALRLNITVVGEGTGGLAATHPPAHSGNRIMIPGSARVLADVGAGIQVSTNVTRLLLRWGLRPALHAYGVEPTAIVFRRYDTGERLGCKRSVPYTSRHAVLPNPPRELPRDSPPRLSCMVPGMRISLSTTARDVRPYPAVAGGPSVRLAPGEVLYAALVVAADGVKSSLQKVLTGLDDWPEPTGDAAYRAGIFTDLMLPRQQKRPCGLDGNLPPHGGLLYRECARESVSWSWQRSENVWDL